MKVRYLIPILLALASSVVLCGCGGSPGQTGLDVPANDQSTFQPDKALPDLAALAAEMQTKTLPELLAWNVLPKARTVKGTQCSWFRTPVPTRNRVVVVTLQQAPNKDSDLYVFNNWPMRPNWKIGQSRRFANDTMPDYTAMGVPDWVACTLTKASGAGYIMVYGEAAAKQTNQFTIQTDVVATLSNTGTVTHGSAAYRDSKWYRFAAQSGKLHTITCTVGTDSDADMVLYDLNSDGYKASDYTVGTGGVITFTPSNTHMHYLRVYGTAAAKTSTYDLTLTVAP